VVVGKLVCEPLKVRREDLSKRDEKGKERKGERRNEIYQTPTKGNGARFLPASLAVKEMKAMMVCSDTRIQIAHWELNIRRRKER